MLGTARTKGIGLCSHNFQSMVCQIAYQPGQVHFRVSGLQPTLQRGLQSTLNLGAARALAEESRIATKVLDGRESDRFNAVT
jgi:hypothetical protein